MTFKVHTYAPCQPLSFKSRLKKLYKAGKIPIKYDLYGSPMTRKTVTDEHIIPKSKGGTSVLSNIALATKKNNNARGNKDIRYFLSWDQVEKYLAQFDGIKVKDFDLKGYVDNVRRTFQRIWSKKK